MINIQVLFAIFFEKQNKTIDELCISQFIKACYCIIILTILHVSCKVLMIAWYNNKTFVIDALTNLSLYTDTGFVELIKLGRQQIVNQFRPDII